jgi:hypothetical protein
MAALHHSVQSTGVEEMQRSVVHGHTVVAIVSINYGS